MTQEDTIVYSVDIPSRGVRTSNRRIVYENGESEYQSKTKKQTFDFYDIGIRVRDSAEVKLKEVPALRAQLSEGSEGLIVRKKMRFSFTQSNIRIDMTQVTSNGKVKYEIEVEIIDVIEAKKYVQETADHFVRIINLMRSIINCNPAQLGEDTISTQLSEGTTSTQLSEGTTSTQLNQSTTLNEASFVFINRFNVDSLAFSGGGVCGTCHVGVINALADNNLFINFKHFTGASVGSIIAALCALKAQPQTIKELMDFDFASLLDDDYGIIRDNLRLWYEMGYYKGDALYDKIRQCVATVCGNPDITFGELTDTTLQIPVTFVWKNGCEVKVYSSSTTPTESIALACRMSCTYPSLFRSINSTSDGGLLCNYPISYLVEGRRLGVNFEYIKNEAKEPATNLGEYLTSIITSLHSICNVNPDPNNTITIKLKIDPTNFTLTAVERTELYNIGYNALIEYLK